MMATLEDVLGKLKAEARSDQLEGMARYGISVEKRLGVAIPEIRKIAKEVGKDHELAQALWQTGIDEARIIASMVDRPEEVSEAQMEAWVNDFNSWDVCDQVCMNLFEKAPLAWKKIEDWSIREEQFVKRAAFTLIACLAWHDKKASDEVFIQSFPIMLAGSTDGRSMVKKSVSWALRNIGKRNATLNRATIEVAQRIREIDSKSARWVAADVLRELTSEKIRHRLNG
jgi:3-methyladenine DNA glycosylase AlkD